MRAKPVLGLIALVLALWAMPMVAMAEGPYEREMREIARQLQCPVCQNLSVLDSPSPLAAEMRAIILEKLQAGETREQIIGYFVDRYGEGVLLDPPKQGFSLLVWVVPALLVLGGGFVVVQALRQWVRQQGELTAELEASRGEGQANGSEIEGPEEERLEIELARRLDGLR
jgi:cytochrome c-type biogenesis protein CcmH